MKTTIHKEPLADARIEERIITLLPPGSVLSLNEISAALGRDADTGRVRRALIALQRKDVVALRAQRRGLWYLGYARNDGVCWKRVPEEIPQPFRKLLSRPW